VPELRHAVEVQRPSLAMTTLEKVLDLYATYQAKRLAASWAFQDRVEQNRRMHFVLRLAVELHHVRTQTYFATALAESAIEDIITGDWDRLPGWIRMLQFTDDPATQHSRPIYARFVEVLQEAVDVQASKAVTA